MGKTKAKRDWPVVIITGILVLLLCVKLASLGWRFFVPKEQPTIFPEESNLETGLGIAGTLFGRAPMVARVSAPPADIVVFGVLASNKKDRTSALFLINGQQREVFGIGEEVVPGLVVTKVTPTEVLLEGSAGEMKLPVIEESAVGSPATGSGLGVSTSSSSTRSPALSGRTPARPRSSLPPPPDFPPPPEGEEDRRG